MLRLFPKVLRLTLASMATAISCPLFSASPADVVEGRWSYQSGGRTIRVDTFLPAETDMPQASKRYPAVLVLYGSGGVLLGKGEMVKVSRQLAQHGMAAFLIHYFNRTGTVVARDPAIYKHWPTWVDTVNDGVSQVSAHPRVNPSSIGMFGYSLGAFLAVAESTKDARIDAVAEVSGGVFDGVAERARRFPSMLIQHGRDDDRVPMMPNLTRFKEMTARFHATPQMKFYDNQGHSFTKEYSANAGARAVEFLQNKLISAGKDRTRK